MTSKEDLETHYSKLLGIESPWTVNSVNLDLPANKVDIEVSYNPNEKVECPVCGEKCSRKDHTEKRTWRHLDTMQFQTLLHARIPRAQCPEHGIKNIKTPWSEPYSRFTLLFVRFAIDVIKACGNLSDAAALLRLSWDEIQLIQARAVKRGMERRRQKHIKYLGIDEKNFKKGRKFVTVLNDLENQRVLDVRPGKNKEAADELLLSLSKRTRNSVKAVAMDMTEVYRRSVEEKLPDAAIVFDKFHLVRYLSEAVASIWKSESYSLSREKNDILIGTKFLWLKNPEKFTDEQRNSFRKFELQAYKVGRGWSIKEAFKKFWTYNSKGYAKKFFTRWYFWATHSRLKPMIRAAKTLKRHLAGMLTYFDHPITNAGSEGMNARIQAIKASARGFRSFEHYRTSILFHCGKLELYP